MAALTAAMVETYNANPGGMVGSGLYAFDRSLVAHLANICAVRMAGVSMISAATIWSRSRTMPRWVTLATDALALVQLVTGGHIRRRADTIAMALCVLALIVLVPSACTTDGVEAAEVVASLPTVVAPLAALPYDLLVVWSVAMAWLACARRHWRLARSLVAGIPVAVAVALVLNAALGLEDGTVDLAMGAPQAGVPVQLIVSVGLASIAARELSRPFRTTAHRLAGAAVLGAVLPAAAPYRVLCAVVAAGVTAGLVRLAFGTPRTTVSSSDVRLGCSSSTRPCSSCRPRSVTCAGGPLVHRSCFDTGSRVFLSGIDPALRHQYRHAGRVSIRVDEALEVFEATPILRESSIQAYRRAREWLAEDDQQEEQP